MFRFTSIYNERIIWRANLPENPYSGARKFMCFDALNSDRAALMRASRVQWADTRCRRSRVERRNSSRHRRAALRSCIRRRYFPDWTTSRRPLASSEHDNTRQQPLRIHRLREMLIEARLVAALQVFLLSPTGERYQAHRPPPRQGPKAASNFKSVQIR